VVRAGTVPLGEDRSFNLDLPGPLAPGAYTLAALIAVNDNVMNAEIWRFPLVATGP
jgi:hypothetical protein